VDEPAWEIEQDGPWYYVTARATCPTCGEELVHHEERRVASGEPKLPALTLTVTPSGGAELSATGYLLPMVVHRCADRPG
jgi:ribosomal protein S27AE